MKRKIMVLGVLAIGTVSTAVTAAADPGKDVYEKACVTCHGANGKGALPGVPDFTKQGGPLSKPDAVLVEHTLKGFQSPGSPLAMPPKGGNPSLTPEQIREAVRYMRSAFGR